jgi:hypothetical protein
VLLAQEAAQTREELLPRERDAVRRILGFTLAPQVRPQLIQGPPLVREIQLDRDSGGAVRTIYPVRWMTGRDGGRPL